MPRADVADLTAAVVNCTFKWSPERSHTQGQLDVSTAIMRAHGVAVDEVRAVDHDIAAGVYPDTTERGAAHDDWPLLAPRILTADILLSGTPIWLGDKSSVATRVIARLFTGERLDDPNPEYR